MKVRPDVAKVALARAEWSEDVRTMAPTCNNKIYLRNSAFLTKLRDAGFSSKLVWLQV